MRKIVLARDLAFWAWRVIWPMDMGRHSMRQVSLVSVSDIATRFPETEILHLIFTKPTVSNVAWLFKIRVTNGA